MIWQKTIPPSIAALAALAGGVLVSSEGSVGPTLVAVIAATLIGAAIARSPTGAVFAALSLLVYAHTESAQTQGQLSLTALRIAAWVILAVSVTRNGYLVKRSRDVSVVTKIALLGVCAYFFATFGASTIAVSGSLVGFICAVLVLRLVYLSGNLQSVRNGLQIFLRVVVVSCLAYGLLVPQDGIAGERLEGWIANANTLGFLAGLTVLLELISRRRFSAVFLISATTALIWTASRSAGLGVTLTVILLAFSSDSFNSRRRIKPALVIMIAGLSMYLFFAAPSSRILRQDDSRGQTLEYWREEFLTQPLFGVGFERSSVEVASSPLRWAVEGGLPALICVLVAYAALLAWSWGRPNRLIVVYGLVSSLFEGWFFAGGSILFFSFWLAVIGYESRSNFRTRGADTSADASIRRYDRPGCKPSRSVYQRK